MSGAALRRLGALLVGAVAVLGVEPGVAAAHGPVAPVASSYVAQVNEVPPGTEARVIDGDQRMWLRGAPSQTAVVLDNRGAPYLRFSRAGVEVNRNSAMYYLNQTPAHSPPSNLTASTPPSWQYVTGGHAYDWHDGRLHALASVALAPGASYVGRWMIPVRVDGRLTAISGGLWHAGPPTPVWFWPIVVAVACLLAALRLRRPPLELKLARILATVALAAIAVAALSRGLYGRPSVSVPQLVTPAITLAFVGWGLYWLLMRRAGYFFLFAVAFVGIWEGGLLLPVLWHGYVLTAVPAFLARAATVTCIACSLGLLLVAVRMPGSGGADDGEDADLVPEHGHQKGRSMA